MVDLKHPREVNLTRNAKEADHLDYEAVFKIGRIFPFYLAFNAFLVFDPHLQGDYLKQLFALLSNTSN